MAYTTINKSTDYFSTKLYTGNSSANHAITGVGHAPDFVWLKRRTSATDNSLYDAVRGATKSLRSESADAEATSTGLTSFDSDGFTVGSAGTQNGGDMVSWNWKANGQGSANTSGSINTTYTSANTTSGFSIVKYTGTGSTGTVAHGLGTVPKIYFVKNLDTSDSWNVFAKTGDMDENYRLLLDTSGARIADGDAWNSQVPTSSFFTVGSNTGTNKSGSNMIAYVFSEVKGFSKFGQYTGNGSADGAYVCTGFKPAWILLKRFDSGTLDWNIYDSKRLGYNGGDAPLFANLSNAESNDYGRIDFLSNGFKIRSSNDQVNNPGGKYLYMCLAEAPLVGSNNVPANAR